MIFWSQWDHKQGFKVIKSTDVSNVKKKKEFNCLCNQAVASVALSGADKYTNLCACKFN